MLDSMCAEDKKEKFKETLMRLIKKMDMADVGSGEEKEEEMPEEMASEESPKGELSEMLAEGKEEAEEEESLSDEEIKELLGAKNKMKKPSSMMSVSVMSAKPMAKKAGRQKGSKGRF